MLKIKINDVYYYHVKHKIDGIDKDLLFTQFEINEAIIRYADKEKMYELRHWWEFWK